MTASAFLPDWPPAANAFLIFGLLLLAGLAGGRLAATTRVLPAITGYIATGFLLGPGVLGWLTDEMLAQSRVLAEFSLGLIVFDLGRRLDLKWASHDRWLLPIGGDRGQRLLGVRQSPPAGIKGLAVVRFPPAIRSIPAGQRVQCPLR